MSLIDLILNAAGLLLWLSWRTEPFNPQKLVSTRTLIGTLRRADSPRLRRWHFLAILAGLLFCRAVVYWQIGPGVNWTASTDLGVISVSFRSDVFKRMLLFSVLSFGVTLVIFYLCLLLLSLLRGPTGESLPANRFVHTHLGRMDTWPRGLRLVLPWLGVGLSWWLSSWPLAYWAVIPHPVSAAHRFEQALVVGLGSYLAWKHLVVGLLALHIVNTYVYFGDHPFWKFVDQTALTLVRPLRRLPLRIGKVDLSPAVAIVVVLVLGQLVETGLMRLYARLPL